MQLEGKRALITGAGSGIGRALAIEASRRGMTVALCGRRADALYETLSQMAPGNGHLRLRGDITDPAVRRGLRDYLWQHWGGLDVLVNNAGARRRRSAGSHDDAELERVMVTNVVAPLALSREMLPLLRRAMPSRIVNVGSMFGDIAYPLFATYSASKFALRGLSIAMRRELKPYGIGVTYAAPRATKTESQPRPSMAGRADADAHGRSGHRRGANLAGGCPGAGHVYAKRPGAAVRARPEICAETRRPRDRDANGRPAHPRLSRQTLRGRAGAGGSSPDCRAGKRVRGSGGKATRSVPVGVPQPA